MEEHPTIIECSELLGEIFRVDHKDIVQNLDGWLPIRNNCHKKYYNRSSLRETAYFKCTQAALLHRQYDLETTYTQLTLIHITNKSIDATVITFSPTLGWVQLYGH